MLETFGPKVTFTRFEKRSLVIGRDLKKGMMFNSSFGFYIFKKIGFVILSIIFELYIKISLDSYE